jgi:lincosamide nucleotidyltransferase A/C/D/E
MMNEQDAAGLLRLSEKNNIEVWLDGGWGVDALLGRQTRPHNDLDVFIVKKNAAAFIKMIVAEGYQEILVEYTTESHTVWRDTASREVDLHLFEFKDEGTIVFENEAYPAEVFSGRGIVGSVAVRCLTPEAQLLFHQGYEGGEKDLHDVLLLCETFGFPIPAAYEKMMKK